MGVVNVTPDSFSDGGRWFEPASAIAHGMDLFAAGAAIVDVGGESTRPGAEPVEPAEEQRRVLPVIEALADHGRISVDTRNEETAVAAVAAGATHRQRHLGRPPRGRRRARRGLGRHAHAG